MHGCFQIGTQQTVKIYSICFVAKFAIYSKQQNINQAV